jgi:predicted type IV restriction endonuclease
MSQKKINLIKKCFICRLSIEQDLLQVPIVIIKYVKYKSQHKILKLEQIHYICKSCQTINLELLDKHNYKLDTSFFIKRDKNKIELKETKTMSNYKNLNFARYINETENNNFMIVTLEASYGFTKDGKPTGKDTGMYKYMFSTTRSNLTKDTEYNKKKLAQILVGEYNEDNSKITLSIDRDIIDSYYRLTNTPKDTVNPIQLDVEEVMVKIISLLDEKEKKINELIEELDNRDKENTTINTNLVSKDSKVEEEIKKDV